jgi:hypothetical protein
MSINYVLATHPTMSRRLATDKYSPYILRYHLQLLSSLLYEGCAIKQVTIVHPNAVDETNEYYTKNNEYIEIIKSKGIDVIDMPVEDIGLSYTQYIKCYNKYNNFDYYYITEDDWIINHKYPNFDKILLEKYRENFKDNVGLLDCWSPNSGRFVNSSGDDCGFGNMGFHSAITLGLLSNKTMETISKQFDLSVYIDQYTFSRVILKNNFPIKDLITCGINTRILFWQAYLSAIQDFSDPDLKYDEPFYIPIQYYYKEINYKNMYTNNISLILNDDNLFKH